ncbi:50S ribosomal protein L27 [Candidatus Cerribacteria bacterium 'Amazon FNV 2010 28 9']|uniref:Large ribosomal subunit protein bL27 n=1 Tax=Candidatus Cerribacteria bacterium 'Amazon FNV 2010 28 9' TaxID=2081795 RepID=A0A317JLZ1_9BACT|nr:MAG: 50S ribosomal protein L27 [Candidatus Cerribacteria bacterium 'Amazon FNV 2010 28 9']
MSHVKAGGSTRQHHQRPGKRLGLKKSGGQAVTTGQIILRQKGQVYKAGTGVGVGRDYTIFSMIKGIVTFTKMHGKTVVNVLSK